jgi:cobalt-zinc-cadmium efflux system outer membrane protein
LISLAALHAMAFGAAAGQTSLTLDATVRRVLATHPSLAAASARVQAARGTRLTARSWTNPVFTYEVENPALPGRSSVLGVERQVTVMASLPLEPIYQIGARAARAGAEVRATEADYGDQRRRLALAAVGAFYRVASADVAVGALDDIRGWLDSLLVHARARVKEGAAAESDLIRLEVEYGRIATDLALARIEQVRADAALASMVGMDSVRVDVTALHAMKEVGPLPPQTALIATARARRPDIIGSDARVAAAAAGASLERRAIVRQMGITGGSMTVAGVPAAVAGVSLSLPLFDQNRGEIHRADAERRVAAHERTVVEREVIADVTGAYEAVRTLSAERAKFGDDLLRRAEEGRRIAEGAYREGATSLVQVLDAARALADARQLYYRALYVLQQSVIELNAAVGLDDITNPGALMTPATPSREGGR